MSDEIVFYTNPMSRGRTARWMLEEVGAPYRTELLDYGTTMKAPAFLAVNPLGKVPAIAHRGKAVTEVSAICAYLADAFPEAGLAPPQAERADYYRWLFFTSGPFESGITNASLGFEAPKERAGMLGYAAIPAMLDALEDAIDGRQFIAGDRFSAADVYVGAQLAFQMQFGTIEKRPALAAYVAALEERPARRRAAAIDDALLAPQTSKS